ncbi:ABC transporter permease [uncultured Mucilaginibacter sp.]|uniref:ABC transporter permease n=1 Tax=uncultured Mucilaginibacter sp. TaxID=797541 RepID=UPI00261756FB|nr:ABC transporter permease [uncultured Mucilaginibacter sp.]
MFKIYFKTGYRNLLKNTSFTLINLIGLTLGLASVMVLSLLVYEYLTTNSIFKNQERLVYLKTYSKSGEGYNQTPFPLLDEIVKACPDVEAATHVQSFHSPWLKYQDKEFQDNTIYGETGFFKVFSFPFESGNAATALSGKYDVVLSHETAEKLFGKVNPVGKTITADDTTQLTVTGVLKPIPANATLRPTVILSINLLKTNPGFVSMANWYNTFAENYLLLKPGANKKRITYQINQIVKTNYAADNKNQRIKLAPFEDLVKAESGDTISVIIKGATGSAVFILLIIVANLINLNMATMFNRAKEVAVKQIVGSSKMQIVWQFCVENAILVFTSLLLAFLLFRFVLLAQINQMVKSNFSELSFDLVKDYPLTLVILFTGTLVVILAGSYPALYLTSIKITDTVKGKLSNNNSNFITRNALITLQFTLAIIFIGVTLILNRQMSFMKKASPGYNQENVLVVPLDLAFKNPAVATARFDAVLNDLRNNPYIKNISTSYTIPTTYQQNYNTYYDPATGKEVSLRQAATDAGLIDTYQIPLVEGRNFKNVADTNEKSNVIINRSAMKALGWTTAIGKQLKPKGVSNEVYNVIGVMEDFHYRRLSESIEPIIHSYAGKQSVNYKYLSLRIDPKHAANIFTKLEKEFNAINPRRAFSYKYMSDLADQQYALLNGILKVTNYVATITLFIAAMGMFGLIALFARQRVKEIGIRKVLGASTSDIVQLLSGNFILLVAVAAMIATPLSLLIMSKWLQSFAYRTELSWWLFAVAAGIALVIALATVSFQAVKAALANPVKSLRSE